MFAKVFTTNAHLTTHTQKLCRQRQEACAEFRMRLSVINWWSDDDFLRCGVIYRRIEINWRFLIKGRKGKLNFTKIKIKICVEILRVERVKTGTFLPLPVFKFLRSFELNWKFLRRLQSKIYIWIASSRTKIPE